MSQPSFRASAKTKSERALEYLASLSNRVVGYFFPLFLLLLEWVLRFAFEINTQEFIGPTLASVGVGMIISLTSSKEVDNKLQLPELVNLSPQFAQLITNKIVVIERRRVRIFANICWLFTLILILLWVASITLSTKYSGVIFAYMPAHYWPGIISFSIGIVLSEIREFL